MQKVTRLLLPMLAVLAYGIASLAQGTWTKESTFFNPASNSSHAVANIYSDGTGTRYYFGQFDSMYHYEQGNIVQKVVNLRSMVAHNPAGWFNNGNVIDGSRSARVFSSQKIFGELYVTTESAPHLRKHIPATNTFVSVGPSQFNGGGPLYEWSANTALVLGGLNFQFNVFTWNMSTNQTSLVTSSIGAGLLPVDPTYQGYLRDTLFLLGMKNGTEVGAAYLKKGATTFVENMVPPLSCHRFLAGQIIHRNRAFAVVQQILPIRYELHETINGGPWQKRADLTSTVSTNLQRPIPGYVVDTTTLVNYIAGNFTAINGVPSTTGIIGYNPQTNTSWDLGTLITADFMYPPTATQEIPVGRMWLTDGVLRILSIGPLIFGGQFVHRLQQSVLPLGIVQFTGSIDDGVPKLAWITRNETNVRHFEIEISENASDFKKIDVIQAKNTPDASYTWHGRDIRSLSYYRLKIVEMNGSFTYSPIVKITSTKKPFAVTIYPNPVKDQCVVSITNDRVEKVNILLTSIDSKVISTYHINTVQGTTTIPLNQNLRQGTYLLTVLSSGERTVLKLIRQ